MKQTPTATSGGAADAWLSMDFFVLPTATFRLLFVLIVLHHERRRIVHST